MNVQTLLLEHGAIYKIKSTDVVFARGTAHLRSPEMLLPFFAFAKDVCDFTMLVGICGVDYPERLPRFELVYLLMSLGRNERLVVKVDVDLIR
jgi:NADH:ubiquinone oxidoreductase subunit C